MDKNQTSAQDDIKTLLEKIKEINTAMLSTVNEDDSIRSRPMRHLEANEDGTIYFFTEYNSGKADEIKSESQVNLSYSKPGDQVYVSVSGRAQVYRDQQKIDELWNPAMKAWFPDGKDDSKIAILKVTVEKAEYWDSPSSAVVHLYGMVKAAITGEQPHIGDNKKVNL